MSIAADFQKVQFAFEENGGVIVFGPESSRRKIVDALRPTVVYIRSVRCKEKKGISFKKFETLKSAVVRFACLWGLKAERLGWTFEELFSFAEPLSLSNGAAWHIGDANIVDVSAAAIIMKTENGLTQRYYRKSLQ